MPSELTPEQLKEKLHKALTAKAVLNERSKQLERQVDDARRREEHTERLVDELVERQRELNFMLHRASSVLLNIQEANAVLSTEFTELVKELPSPENPDWEDRVAKINDLFKKTGALTDEVQSEIFKTGLSDEKQEHSKNKSVVEPPVAAIPKIDTPAATPEPQPVKPEVVAEPAVVYEPEPVVEEEPVIEAVEAEISQPVEEDPHIPSEPAAVVEEPEEPEAEESQDEEKPIDRVNRLFDQLQEIDNEKSAEAADKPGFLTRTWRKLTGKDKKNDNSDDNEDSDESEPIEMISDPEPEIEETIETVEVSYPQQDQDITQMPDLRDEKTDDIESVQVFETEGVAVSEEVSTEPEKIHTPSFYERLRNRFVQWLDNHSEAAVARAHARRIKRINRHIRPDTTARA